MMDSIGFKECLLFIQEFGTDCFCLVTLTVCNYLDRMYLYLSVSASVSVLIGHGMRYC